MLLYCYNISYHPPPPQPPTTDRHLCVCVYGNKKCLFFETFCLSITWMIPRLLFVKSLYHHWEKLLLKYTLSLLPFNNIFKRDYCHCTIQTPYLIILSQIRVMIPCIKLYRYVSCSTWSFRAKHFFQPIQDQQEQLKCRVSVLEIITKKSNIFVGRIWPDWW